MQRSVCWACLVAFVGLTATASAQQTEKQKQLAIELATKSPLFQLPKEITLSDEQQAKLKTLQEEYVPKWVAASQKQTAILTKEQRKARTEANKANRAAKKTGKEAQEAVLAALMLTDQQKGEWEAAQKEVAALRKEIEQKKQDLLTPEQKAQLPKPKKAKGN